MPADIQLCHPGGKPARNTRLGRGKMGRKKETPRPSRPGRGSTLQDSHAGVLLSQTLLLDEHPRLEKPTRGCSSWMQCCFLAPAPQAGSSGLPSGPLLPQPCVFGSVQGPPRSPLQQRGRTKHSLVLGTSSKQHWIALPNPDRHLLVPARQLSCQHTPGWPRFPAPPPARSFNWTSLVHAENTRGLVRTRRALTPARGGDLTASRRSRPRRKALTWKAAVRMLIPLNNVHFHIHQKMVKRQDGGLFTM